ncbi:MAG: alpha-L-fucosidase [Pirellulales bacterium]|nr:alpha-L-fucosidase [Pirellulales bacterium]
MNERLRALVACATTLAALVCGAARAAADNDVQKGMKAAPQDVQEWRRLKFGLFIHWGPVSLQGTEIGWSRGGERRGTTIGIDHGGVPVDVYDNLYKQFNPVKFDAREWVDIAKAAGMKYLVFTTKHHDGFVNFDSKLTDYKITSPQSPYGRDLVKQLADACHDGGLIWGIYYSQPDWHHPDYRTERHAEYIKYLHGQMRELLTHYGDVRMIFFDGLGGTAEDWDAPALIPLCRKLQPRILINNRCGVPADFDTPEQRIGRMQTDRPWETCMTLGDQWAWKPNDRIKSLKQCLDTLVRVVGGDGNLLFNVGPMPDGRIEPRQVERLKEMGQWLAQYGQTIHDTRGGPFPPEPWGAATSRGNRIFLHVLDPEMDQVVLPPIDKKIVSHKVLTGGTVLLKQNDKRIVLAIPKANRDAIDTIVELTLDGPAADVKLGSLHGASVAQGKPATASNVFGNQIDEFGPQCAVDGDPQTRWATDAGTRAAWLEVDLGEPTTVAAVQIAEAYAGRVQQCELQGRNDKDGPWQTFWRGKKIAQQGAVTFEPATARYIRLNIPKASEGPTIWEFRVFGPSSE